MDIKRPKQNRLTAVGRMTLRIPAKGRLALKVSAYGKAAMKAHGPSLHDLAGRLKTQISDAQRMLTMFTSSKPATLPATIRVQLNTVQKTIAELTAALPPGS